MIRKFAQAYKYLQQYNHSRSVSPFQLVAYILGL